MNPNIERLKQIIKEGERDGDYWYYTGDSLLIEVMNEFVLEDWFDLKADLINWKSDELTLIADAASEVKTGLIDVNVFYGYVITIADDDDAFYLIQNLQILDDNRSKPIELLNQIRERVSSLRYAEHPLIESDYLRYNDLIDGIVKKQSSKL